MVEYVHIQIYTYFYDRSTFPFLESYLQSVFEYKQKIQAGIFFFYHQLYSGQIQTFWGSTLYFRI